MKLQNSTKLILVILCLFVSVAGFLIKLPSGFRHVDKELHSLFYFLAAAFLNLLFVYKSVTRHALVFAVLYFFGIAIEYAQDYSNKFFHKRIHGRFDPEDVQANLKGLLFFSAVWIVYTAVLFAYGKLNAGKMKKS